jgi:hypothetical protein
MPTCQGCRVEFRHNQLSRRRLCHLCSYQRVSDSIEQMRAKRGVYYDLWQVAFERGMKRVWGNQGKGSLS